MACPALGANLDALVVPSRFVPPKVLFQSRVCHANKQSLAIYFLVLLSSVLLLDRKTKGIKATTYKELTKYELITYNNSKK